MPIVLVHHKKDRLTDDMLSKLGPAIAESVANALNVPTVADLHLTSAEVEVRFSESGPYDTNVKDIGILVFGNGGPDRESNLISRTDQIRDELKKFLADYDRNLTLYVYVMLQKAHYVEV